MDKTKTKDYFNNVNQKGRVGKGVDVYRPSLEEIPFPKAAQATQQSDAVALNDNFLGFLSNKPTKEYSGQC